MISPASLALAHVLRPSGERHPPCPWRKRTSLSLTQGDPRRLLIAAAPCPPFHTFFTLLQLHIPARFSALHQTQPKNTQVQRLLRVFISLRSVPCHARLRLNKSACFSPANASLSVWISHPDKVPRRVKDNFFLPHRCGSFCASMVYQECRHTSSLGQVAPLVGWSIVPYTRRSQVRFPFGGMWSMFLSVSQINKHVLKWTLKWMKEYNFNTFQKKINSHEWAHACE